MAAVSLANIKLVGSHAGISIGQDGPSQMALEDLAMMRAVEGSTVLYPSDAVSCEKLVEDAARTPGIVYVRASRPKVPVLYNADESFPVGGLKVLRESASDQALVVAAGVTLYEALRAYDELKSAGILVRVVDLYSLKPIDAAALVRAAAQAGNRVITVEDHYPEGGVGDAVLAALATSPAKVKKLAVTGLPRCGEPEELLDMFGISAPHIVRAVKEVTAG
jgi:transketolase